MSGSDCIAWNVLQGASSLCSALRNLGGVAGRSVRPFGRTCVFVGLRGRSATLWDDGPGQVFPKFPGCTTRGWRQRRCHGALEKSLKVPRRALCRHRRHSTCCLLCGAVLVMDGPDHLALICYASWIYSQCFDGGGCQSCPSCSVWRTSFSGDDRPCERLQFFGR